MKRFNLIALIFAFLIALTPNQALADIGGLTKCSESPAFAKRLKIIPFGTEFVENPTKPNEKKIDIDLSSKLPLWKQDFMLLLIEYYKIYLTNGLVITDNITIYI